MIATTDTLSIFTNELLVINVALVKLLFLTCKTQVQIYKDIIIFTNS